MGLRRVDKVKNTRGGPFQPEQHLINRFVEALRKELVELSSSIILQDSRNALLVLIHDEIISMSGM